MMRFAVALGACLIGSASWGQEIVTSPIDPALPSEVDEIVSGIVGPIEGYTNGALGTLRVLDKITGIVTDLEMAPASEMRLEHLTVRFAECRYPVDNPTGDAIGLMSLFYQDGSEPIFQGWMIASSPALNALDHARYDVWMLRCTSA